MKIYTTPPKPIKQNPKSIKCPHCKKGRICNAPKTSESLNAINKVDNSITIKCPNCGLFAGIVIKDK